MRGQLDAHVEIVVHQLHQAVQFYGCIGPYIAFVISVVYLFQCDGCLGRWLFHFQFQVHIELGRSVQSFSGLFCQLAR